MIFLSPSYEASIPIKTHSNILCKQYDGQEPIIMLEAQLRGLKERNAQARSVVNDTDAQIVEVEKRIQEYKSARVPQDKDHEASQNEKELYRLILNLHHKCPDSSAKSLAAKLDAQDIDSSILGAFCSTEQVNVTVSELGLSMGDAFHFRTFANLYSQDQNTITRPTTPF